MEQVKISDKILDGVYTLGFKAYRTDRPNEESMLGGFFDKNIKMTVKDGKATLKMLNLMNADMLYDFRVENKNKYNKSTSQWIGEADSRGNYFMQTFEFPIEDLGSKHIGGVLVSAMGGSKSDIGNVDKYTKVTFVFDKILRKGWNGFEILNKQKSSDDLLNEALMYRLSDENKDGKISNEEIAKAKGEVRLANYKFKDISRLKYLGAGVTRLHLNANKIDKLPKGVFDNLVNLECLYLNGNKIKELPEGIFDKLTKLKKLVLAANLIEKLPKGIFDKLVSLEQLQLGTNKIMEIEEGVFDKLINIKSIDLPDNNIKKIHDNSFGNLKHLKEIYLYNNKLENIPKGIGNLENLEDLDLNSNKITSIPKELSKLKKLTDLNLHTNYIKEFPKEIYGNLNEIINLDISDNQIQEVPKNILELFPKAYKLDFSMNKIKNHLNIKNQSTFRELPQKSEMNLSVFAKDGEIKWKQDIDSLDMLYWAFMISRNKPNNLPEYNKFMENERGNKNIKDIIPFEWNIINEIQKKNSEGKYETIKKIVISNENDMLNGIVKDPAMKKGSEYRIVKNVFKNQGSNTMNIFNDVALAVAESDAKKDEKNIEEKSKVYDLKVKILKENQDELSMAGNYIKKVTYEIKDGKHYIIAKLNRSDWMKNIKATVYGKEITPEILNKEKNSNGEETSDIKFEVKDLNSKIALAMNIEPMGNSRVSFRIAPEQESLNLIKADQAKENIKDNQEIKNEELEKENNKESSKPKETTNKDEESEIEQDIKNAEELKKEEQSIEDKSENAKKEVENKKAELEKINIKIKEAKKKIKQEKNKLNNNTKEKNGIYNVKFDVLKENEDKPSMAANYIQKVAYEIKDGKHYVIAKLNRSDWMKNIKATVDGKEIKPEILNKEKNSNGEETSDIKFEVKDLNSKVALGMNVEPMGNNRVLFRIVPKEDSIKMIRDNAKNDNTKSTPELEQAIEELKKLNEQSKKLELDLNDAKQKLEKAKADKESNKDSNNIKEEVKDKDSNDKEIANTENEKPVENLSNKTDINTGKNEESKKEENKHNNDKQTYKQNEEKGKETVNTQQQSVSNLSNKTNLKTSNTSESNTDLVKNISNDVQDTKQDISKRNDENALSDNSSNIINEQNSNSGILPKTGSKIPQSALLGLGSLLATIGTVLFRKKK